MTWDVSSQRERSGYSKQCLFQKCRSKSLGQVHYWTVWFRQLRLWVRSLKQNVWFWTDSKITDLKPTDKKACWSQSSHFAVLNAWSLSRSIHLTAKRCVLTQWSQILRDLNIRLACTLSFRLRLEKSLEIWLNLSVRPIDHRHGIFQSRNWKLVDRTIA